ncbi:MAG: hypothetical protein AAF577_00850 [Pseudomonadota bacterium]
MRAGRLNRLARPWLCAFALLLAASPALAEVCDKMRPAWSPVDGPVGHFGEVLFYAASPMGLATLAMLLALAALGSLRRARVAWLVTTALLWLPVPYIALGASVLEDTAGVQKTARREGCFGNPLLLLIVLSVGGLLCLRAPTRH